MRSRILKLGLGVGFALAFCVPESPSAVRQVEGRPVYFAGDKPFFVYSATFAYEQYPRDLWPGHMVRLKRMGFNTLQVPVRSDGSTSDLQEVLRLGRQLGFRIWLDRSAMVAAGAAAAPSDSASGDELPFARGGAVLDGLDGKPAAWFPAPEAAPASKRLLYPADFASLRRLIPKPPQLPVVTAHDAGWSAGEDVRARPADPSNYLLAMRELLATGVKALNCSAVLEEQGTAAREAAIGLAGDERPQTAILSRNGALLRQFGPMLAAMHQADAPAHLALGSNEKSPPLLRLATLAFEPRGPAWISALNFSESHAVKGTLAAVDPRTAKPVLLRNLNLPPRQALLMPVNFPISRPEICGDCSSFAPDERIVWATAELLSVSFENGVLAMEFVAPAEGEVVLELAREPRGPLITGGRPKPVDWDDKTHRVSARIPAGPAPDFRSRVGLAIELPDFSVFLKTPRRLIIGSTASVTAVFSPPELASRSRLLIPAGWRVKSEPAPASAMRGGEIDYVLDVPADAVAGDTVTLSVETDGKMAQSATLALAPFCDARVEPAEALHPRRDASLPIRPSLATLLLPGRRPYRVLLRNNYDEIRNFDLTAAGDGLRFSPSHLEVSVGASAEREVTLYAAPLAGEAPSGAQAGRLSDAAGDPSAGSSPASAPAVRPRPGVYYWNLEIHDGPRKIGLPLALAVLAPDESLTYEFDLDRDGAPELVIENRKLRAVFSPRHGGRSMELLIKEQGINAFSGRGAFDLGAPMEGRILGPGRIELRSGETTRIISLGAQDSFLDVEQTGGAPQWVISTPADLEATGPRGHARFGIEAPAAKIEATRRPFSTDYHLRFADGSRSATATESAASPKEPMRARIMLEWIEAKPAAK